jgi:hypothetical protein
VSAAIVSLPTAPPLPTGGQGVRSPRDDLAVDRLVEARPERHGGRRAGRAERGQSGGCAVPAPVLNVGLGLMLIASAWRLFRHTERP